MLELLIKRRSIRRFKQAAVEKEKIDCLVKSALLAPSSRGINPWEFIVVTDKMLIEKLSHSKQHGSSFLKGTPLAIVVLADTAKSDVWVEDTSIASIILQLEAESLGLGSCWIQIRNRFHSNGATGKAGVNGGNSGACVMSSEYVKGLLNIPGHYEIASIIAVGYPDEQPEPHKESDIEFCKVHNGIYGSPFKSQ